MMLPDVEISRDALNWVMPDVDCIAQPPGNFPHSISLGGFCQAELMPVFRGIVMIKLLHVFSS